MALFKYLLALSLLLFATNALAHDPDEPEFDSWYHGLTRPDLDHSSCCGKADAYWCDIIHVRHDKVFCTITDDRPDAPRGRPHIDIGTEMEIPPEKMKWGPNDPDKTPPSNPTGHAIIFIINGGSYSPYVLCFVPGTGI